MIPALSPQGSSLPPLPFLPCCIPRVPSKDPKHEFKVGDRVTVSLSGGRIVDATVTAVVKYTKGPRLQVSYGKDETALVYLWQVSAPKV